MKPGTSAAPNDLPALLEEMSAHDRMDAVRRAHPERHFLGGWNGQHPFVPNFLGNLMAELAASEDLLTAYSHLDEDIDLCNRLSDLHAGTYGELRRPGSCYIPASGSSSCLASLLQYAHRLGHLELCYVPPVYYNAIYWIRELGFDVTRVAPFAPLDGGSADRFSLPPRRTLLWLTDPLWFAGRPLTVELVEEIGAWQTATESTVIIDGTFQYMGWQGPGAEASSRLDPDLTFRLVCPTKNLALHGFRFAYMVAPEAVADDFRDFHSRLHGAASLHDRLFAHRAVTVLSSDEAASGLFGYVQERYQDLLDADVFEEHLLPSCGYFVFARPRCDADTFIGLSSSCFEAVGLDGYTRVNLLDEGDVGFLHRPAPLPRVNTGALE